MLFFLITCCFSFIFFHKSLSLNPLPVWASQVRLLSLRFWTGFPFFSAVESMRNHALCLPSLALPRIMSSKDKNCGSKVEGMQRNLEMSVLDLPDLVLECILEKLPPEGLTMMASACTTLRDRCMSDHLWERHLNNKWGRIVGPAAIREWQYHVTSRKGSVFVCMDKQNGLLGFLTNLWPVMLIKSSFRSVGKKNFAPMDSIMHLYYALQSGKFSFPAQVFNRENGHVGFVLSCYDAELSYDPQTDSFKARYPPHGRRASAVETGITWDRIRAPPLDTSPHSLHVSCCLNELKPADHIEIQWRRSKAFPYGWWFGVVGHLDTCHGNATYCQCQDCDTVMLEFNHYGRNSRWRRTTIDRKFHREEGNEAEGFYGGIRKLPSSEEISMWKKFWPSESLE